jgi:hypothetical protein
MRPVPHRCVSFVPEVSGSATLVANSAGLRPQIGPQVVNLAKNHVTANAYAYRTACGMILYCRTAAARKFARKSENLRKLAKPADGHLARMCVIRAPESITFALEFGGFAAVLQRFCDRTLDQVAGLTKNHVPTKA